MSPSLTGQSAPPVLIVGHCGFKLKHNVIGISTSVTAGQYARPLFTQHRPQAWGEETWGQNRTVRQYPFGVRRGSWWLKRKTERTTSCCLRRAWAAAKPLQSYAAVSGRAFKLTDGQDEEMEAHPDCFLPLAHRNQRKPDLISFYRQWKSHNQKSRDLVGAVTCPTQILIKNEIS